MSLFLVFEHTWVSGVQVRFDSVACGDSAAGRAEPPRLGVASEAEESLGPPESSDSEDFLLAPPSRPHTPPQRLVLSAERVAGIEGAVRAAAEGVHMEMAEQARSGVEFLLCLSDQVGRSRQAAHIRVMDHRTGVEIWISRYAQQEFLRPDVSLDLPTSTLALQFLPARDQDELRLRQSVEVSESC